MHRTIVTTPSVDTSLRCFSIAFLRLKGWRVKGDLPPTGHKSALIAAPHTSNWDLPYTLTVAFALRLTPYWMGQQNIFKFPFGPLMRWLGGIAVNRQQSTNLVAASAQALAQAKGPLQLIMSPRAHASKRVTGKPVFITSPTSPGPIVMAYMDHCTRRCGLGPVFTPTGDVAAEMANINSFYAPFKG